MDFKDFYLLNDAGKKGALRAKPKQDLDKFALLKAEMALEGPLVFRHFMGNVTHDLIATGYAGLYLLSDDAIDVLQNGGFTGWKTYPVEVYNRYGRPIEGYNGFSVVGYCGPLDNGMSIREWREPRSPKGKPYQAWLGLYFDPAAWDGSDIVSPNSTMHIIIRHSVKEALERARLSNIEFQSLTEVERIML